MTTAELDRIERVLGFPLPGFYRRFMADYPRWLLAKQPEGFDPVTEWEFADDPDRIIHFNRYVRSFGPGEFFDERPWPPSYFVIGSEAARHYPGVRTRHAGYAEINFVFRFTPLEERRTAGWRRDSPRSWR